MSQHKNDSDQPQTFYEILGIDRMEKEIEFCQQEADAITQHKAIIASKPPFPDKERLLGLLDQAARSNEDLLAAIAVNKKEKEGFIEELRSMIQNTLGAA
ncbi:MAG: hypothetical protein HYR56_17000 [Acidobacteria bacterium]|nr:hypothetical protein [Acidobacteriota bacterium]MBI3428002.1 hypothetical protein [Acidobacteriota bacterium]